MLFDIAAYARNLISLLFGIAPKSKQKGLGLYSKAGKLRVILRKHSKLTSFVDSNNECFFRSTILQNKPFQAFFSLHKLCLFLFSDTFSVRAFFVLCSLEHFCFNFPHRCFPAETRAHTRAIQQPVICWNTGKRNFTGILLVYSIFFSLNVIQWGPSTGSGMALSGFFSNLRSITLLFVLVTVSFKMSFYSSWYIQLASVIFFE